MSDNLSVATMKAAISASVERGAFSLFPKLPLELRRMIWWASCCSNQPRLIYVSERVFDEWWQGLVASYQVPSQLQTNQESRECALRFYDFAFGSQMKGTSIYFNFEIDAIVFGGYQALYAFIGLWYNDDNELEAAETPLDKKIMAVAMLDTYWYCGLRATQAVKALGNPGYLQIITSVEPASARDRIMELVHRIDWLRRYRRRQKAGTHIRSEPGWKRQRQECLIRRTVLIKLHESLTSIPTITRPSSRFFHLSLQNFTLVARILHEVAAPARIHLHELLGALPPHLRLYSACG